MFRIRAFRREGEDDAAAAARPSGNCFAGCAAAGSLIDIRNRARSAGVAPNDATRNRTSAAAFVSPRHIDACSNAVSSKKSQSVAVNTTDCGDLRHVSHQRTVAAGHGTTVPSDDTSADSGRSKPRNSPSGSSSTRCASSRRWSLARERDPDGGAPRPAMTPPKNRKGPDPHAMREGHRSGSERRLLDF